MKKLLTIAFILAVGIVFGQSADRKISYVTVKKDTLYLVDEGIGYQIKWVWDSVPRYSGSRPVILMVPQTRIDELCRLGGGMCDPYKGAATIPSSGTIKRKKTKN